MQKLIECFCKKTTFAGYDNRTNLSKLTSWEIGRILELDVGYKVENALFNLLRFLKSKSPYGEEVPISKGLWMKFGSGHSTYCKSKNLAIKNEILGPVKSHWHDPKDKQNCTATIYQSRFRFDTCHGDYSAFDEYLSTKFTMKELRARYGYYIANKIKEVSSMRSGE